MDKLELKYILVVSMLLTVSFPPFPLGFLAPIGITIFLWFIREKPCRDSFRLGYLIGLFWGGMSLFWIAASSITGAVVVISLNAFHYGIVGWVFCRMKQKSETIALLALPFVWVGLEYIRSFSDIRFNWLTLAYTQTYYLPFIQIVELTGYLFISFVLILTSITLYLFIKGDKKSKYIFSILTVTMVLFMNVYGVWRIRVHDTRDYRMIKGGLIQPNVDPLQKWDSQFQEQVFNQLLENSNEILKQEPDLLVWPETATPFYLRTRLHALAEIGKFLDSSRVYLLTGTPDYQYSEDRTRVFTHNAAFFFRPDQIGFEAYYKMALVPGSETVPFKTILPLLRNLDIGGADFFPGKSYNVFKCRVPERIGRYNGTQFQINRSNPLDSITVRLSAIICYESVFPHIVRRFVENGAELLTIITNDGWFGMTSGPFQHARYAVFRAIENRVSIIRCANTGISGYIDPVGRYLRQAPLNSRKNLSAIIPLNSKKTFYTVHGDWFGQICLLISIIFIFFVLFSWRLFRS